MPRPDSDEAEGEPAPTRLGPPPRPLPELGPADVRYAPEAVLRRLASLPEEPMREAVWREVFERRTAAQAVQIVAIVRQALVRREPAGRAGWLALVRVVERLRGGPVALNLYLAARAVGERALTDLVIETPPAKKAEAFEVRPPPLDRDREVTLGERRSWARKPDRATLERILLDPDPGVVRNLLNNPVLVERDVLRLASRRPTTAEVLHELFVHTRWGRRPAIQRALVLNPYAPVDLACGLVALLDLETVRQVRHEPIVHSAVRTTAGLVLGEYERPAEGADAAVASASGSQGKAAAVEAAIADPTPDLEAD